MDAVQIAINGGDILMQTRFCVGDNAKQLVAVGGDK
jgi:hypothetical protein